MNPTDPAPVNLTEFMDRSPISAFQIRVFVLCAAAAFFDGVDSQSIGVAAPYIASALKLSKGQLGLVFSAALIGAAIGAISLGALADRLGRKRVLVAAVVLFGTATAATIWVDSLGLLITWRFIAGIGLGGATPCFISLTSEYSPARWRSRAITLLWAAFPLGGMLGGFLNSYVLRLYDWHTIFVLGGASPILLAICLALWLPESARFISQREGASADLETIARNITGSAQAGPVLVEEQAVVTAPLKSLFSGNRARSTVLLSGTFFMLFGTLANAVLWVPTLLHLGGMSVSDTAVVIGFHQLGALIGGVTVGGMINRFGFAKVLGPALVTGAVLLMLMGYVSTSRYQSAVLMAVIGIFLTMGASGVIALAVIAYPSALCSTAVGWSMSMGRLGQVVAPLMAGYVVQIGFGLDRTFVVVAGMPLIAAVLVVAFCAIRRIRDEPPPVAGLVSPTH